MIHNTRIEKNYFLTKTDTTLLKGVAIVCMLMHHLWGFPDRIAGELRFLFHISNQSSLIYFGAFGRICISFFFFLGGYGLYISSKGKPFDLIGRAKKLFFSYWKVFLVFIPIAFLFFRNQPVYSIAEDICHHYEVFSWKEFVQNFLAVTTSYNWEWWFQRSYMIALVSFPLVRKIVDRTSLPVSLFLAVVCSILVTNVVPALGTLDILGTMENNTLYSLLFCQKAPFIACFWMGVVTAKEMLLTRLHRSLQDHHLLHPVTDVLVICSIIYLRTTAWGDFLDIFYVPVLCVVIIDVLKHARVLPKIFLKLGKYSTNMWLIHSFFCYYFYQFAKLVVMPRWGVPSLLLLVILTFAAAVGVERLWKGISRIPLIRRKA